MHTDHSPHPPPTTAATDVVLDLDHVSRRFTTEGHVVTALDGLSLSVTGGTFTTIMGPSGSGKSTLLHCAVGLDDADEGTITVDGTELNSLDERGLTQLRRERIGFVFQSYNLIASLTALQNTLLPSRLAGRRTRRAEALEALGAVGLRGRAGHRPHQLSGGEQQRVAIARAVVTRPAVVCADEPTGALDLARSRQVLDHLRSLVDDHGRTVFAVTHDPSVAARGDRVVFMADGKIVEDLDRTRGDRFDAGSIAVRLTGLEVA